MSSLLQASDVSIFDIRQHVIATCATLDELAATDLQRPAASTHLRDFMKEHLGEQLAAEDKVLITSELWEWLREWNDYAAKVAREIRNRFPEDASNVVKAFECLFPHTMLASGTTQVQCGLDHFDFLCNTFKPLLPPSDGHIEEYQIFKFYVLNHWRELSVADFLRTSLSNHFLRTSCPVSHKLLLIAATLPMTSVECEHYFSIMKRVKADVHNPLSVAAASSALITATDATSVDKFSPLACISKWNGSKKRKRVAELQICDAVQQHDVVSMSSVE